MFKNLIVRYCLAILVASICHTGYAQDIFQPTLIESSDDAVCQLAMAHYADIYQSNSKVTAGITDSANTQTPEFVSQEVEAIEGVVKTATVGFYGAERQFVYYQRPLGWRGDIYTGYLIKPAQRAVLEAQLISEEEGDIKPFYPMGSLAYGGDFSWWENLPFQHQGKWYVLADFGDFQRHESEREVYQLLQDGSAKEVCRIKIFQNFDASQSGKKLPFFAAYKKSVENIMLSPGDCGSSTPEVDARLKGQLFASMAVIRPWAITPSWSGAEDRWGTDSAEFQQKHLEHWQYQDAWSHREHATFENLRHDAITELKNHYITHFAYAESDALEKASGVIESMPGRYYSLGIYYDQDKDHSFLQRLLEGNYQDWSALQQNLQREFDTIPLAALSLMADVPSQLSQLPEAIPPEDIKTFYNKDILMFAAHMNNYDTVKYLLGSDWPVDKQTSYTPEFSCDPRMERLNRSALTYAAENASVEVMQLLVEAGADVTIKDSQGNSLDYYIEFNPRFSEQEKQLGFAGLMQKYAGKGEIAPSYACDGQLSRIEAAICQSDGLAIYDRELSRLYRDISKNHNLSVDLRESQIQWIKRRNKACKNVADSKSLNACLARTTRARVRYLTYVQGVLGKGS